jgi:hypothetical protein
MLRQNRRTCGIILYPPLICSLEYSGLTPKRRLEAHSADPDDGISGVDSSWPLGIDGFPVFPASEGNGISEALQLNLIHKLDVGMPAIGINPERAGGALGHHHRQIEDVLHRRHSLKIKWV